MASFSINNIIETLRHSMGLQILAALCTILAYLIAQAIYNVYFHPLSKFPGPKLWAASRLPFIHSLLSSKLVRRQREFHETYGEVIRLAPDEISFANEQAWEDIYTYRRGHKRAGRDKTWYIAPNSQGDNLVITSDPKFHLRVRTLLSNSFTEESLRKQYPVIQSHADLLVLKMKDLATTPDSLVTTMPVRINMTDWLNFFTMDVIGDLAFGESFHCLEAGDYHAWVRTLFSYLNGMSIAAAPRFFPSTEFIFQKLIPKKVLEGQRRHVQYANEKINRRLDQKTDRPDLMTPFMKNNIDYQKMSRDEILSTFNFIIIGGSETIATTLTGIFNHLSRHPNILQRLSREVRTKFKEEKDITVDAIPGLPYLEAVINEGLRMCNPFPGGLPRVVPEGGDTYAGIYLPGGTRIGVRTFAINRSSKFFANPDSFVPERWLPQGERPSEYDNDYLSASKPFSVGFHSCLGQRLAWFELRLVLTRLLWAFDFAEDPTDRVDFDTFRVMMIIQKEPMKLRVQVRTGIEYKGPLFK